MFLAMYKQAFLTVLLLLAYQRMFASIEARFVDKVTLVESEVGEPISNDDYASERDEAIQSGSFKPINHYSDDANDVVKAPPFLPLDVSNNRKSNDDLEKAIINDDIEKDEVTVGDPLDAEMSEDNSNWLPKGETIAEETAIINERNHVTKVIDGDILPPPSSGNDKRNAITNKQNLWPGNLVPYYVDRRLNSQGRTALREAIQEIESNSCLRFTELAGPGNGNSIRIFPGGGCYSYVGKISRQPQDLSIGRGCEHKGIVIHELMHAMGFYHEQSRYDRDQYVQIKWENILAGRENNFAKQPQSVATGLGLPYDYDGIMHYGKTAFTKNGQPTILRLRDPNGPLGQRNGLSKTDADQLKILYNCPTKSTERPPVKPTEKPPVEPTKGSTALLTCSFERNLCRWQQARNDRFDWTRRRGKTPSRATGPTYSATGRNGFYVYTEASYPRRFNDFAILRSPIVSPSKESCMNFEAMMYGRGIGGLRVFQFVAPSFRRTLYSRSGNRGKKWQTVKITLPAGRRYQIEIAGIRGRDYRGDIAIDNIKVSQGKCGNSETKPPVTKPPNPPGPSVGLNDKICGTRSTQLQHPLLDTRPQRIVGGQQARAGDWPWQVGMIRSRTSRFIYCGGTLISNEWVISAAHCFTRSQNPSSTYVILGEHSKTTNEGTEQVISLARIIIHENYNSRTMDNDIALLKLSQPVQFTKYIRPACIPDPNSIATVGKTAFVSGWGTTSQGGSVSTILKVASVPIVSQATCNSAYSNGITNSMVCAGYSRGGTDSCQGDSGGPLVDQNSNGRYYLIGVVSWGVGCAQPGRYGVYARVSHLRSWLSSKLPTKG